jgi:chromate reductase
MSDIKVLSVCGSLRKGSFNMMALRVAQSLAPAGMKIDIADISAFTPYNEDVKAQGFPPPVQTFRDQIAAADALLFVTPEYNYSVSGVLKNAIDWASRPPNHPFDGKPVAIMGASGGVLGTARAQYHLRQMCVFLNMFPVNKPEVMIPQAQTRFDAQGNLTDETAKGLIKQLLESLQAWTLTLKRGRAS